MKTSIFIRLFQGALVLAGVVLLLSLFDLPGPEYPRVGGGLLGLWALWLFANLCADVAAIRRLEMDKWEVLEERDLGVSGIPGFSVRTDREVGLEIPPLAEIGDRVFKADETKTCSSCSQWDKPKNLCRWDGVSLSRITTTAVGCQHWSPGLHVTAPAPKQEEAQAPLPEEPEER